MSTLFFYTCMIVLTALLYLPALWSKISFSNVAFTDFRQNITTLYNIIIIIIHLNFINTGYFPLLGVHDTDPMGWLSFLMVFAHGYTIPYPWKSKRWFRHKKLSLKLPKHSFIKTEGKPSSDGIFYFIRLAIMIPACAVFYTVISIYILIQFVEFETYHWRVIASIIFIFFMGLCIYGAKRHNKKHGRVL